jgi:RHS repeat-associated protein
MSTHHRLFVAGIVIALLLAASPTAFAQPIASGSLRIEGMSFEVRTTSVSVPEQTASRVQTALGGKENSEAPDLGGAIAVAELRGASLPEPIILRTTPGHAFVVPGLKLPLGERAADFVLSDIRIVDKSGELLQFATPSSVPITVTVGLEASVTVSQLSVADLRSRGITLDSTRWNVFEFQFGFVLDDGSVVKVPYPIAFDRTTNEIKSLTPEDPYGLPPIREGQPPLRWAPPLVIGTEFAESAVAPPPPQQPGPSGGTAPRRSVPAAIIIPNSLAVLHEGMASGSTGLVRQYVHGDQGYDDPVEVLIRQPDDSVRRYLPVVDEAGTGSIHAVLDADGNLVERTLYGDSYGDTPRYLQGAVVDEITFAVDKDGTGKVEQVEVRLHFSESILGSSVAAGVRLRTTADSEVVSVAPVTASLDPDDDSTVVWRFEAAQWESFAGAGTAEFIEVAVTDALRAEGWGATPVTPAPEWTRILYGTISSAAEPLVHRESILSIAAFIAAAPLDQRDTSTLYTIPDLYLASTAESKAKLLMGFKAYPFVEPANGKVYARARWYDPQTGTFMSPDPMGYQDSSNMYAFAANDPVNNGDPTGAYVEAPLELISLGIGTVSLGYNLSQGNWGSAAWDLFGIGVDTAGLFVPGTLAVGASTKAVRAGYALTKSQKLYLGAQAVQQAGDGGFGLIEASREYQQGNYAWGTFYFGMSAFGFHGAKQNAMELYPLGGYGGLRSSAIPGLIPRVRQKTFDDAVGPIELESRGVIDISSGAYHSAGLDDEEIVYILMRRDTGEVMKVGSTEDISTRFGVYLAKGEYNGFPLSAEVYVARNLNGAKVEAAEKGVRNMLELSGERLLWDNTRQRLLRPGPGVPGTRVPGRLRRQGYRWVADLFVRLNRK